MFQLPREQRRNPLINILEVNDPKFAITFHLMPRLTSLTPHLDSPLAAPMDLQRGLAMTALDEARKMEATEGFLLKNLEKGCKYYTHNSIFAGNFHCIILDFAVFHIPNWILGGMLKVRSDIYPPYCGKVTYFTSAANNYG